MQKDFHYCAIRALAELAGFGQNEAQIIAYSSQYVDDAHAHKPLQINNLPQSITNNYQKKYLPAGNGLKYVGNFDPVCTSHDVKQYLKLWNNKDAQRKVYISFHFIPTSTYSGAGSYDYLTSPDSALANALLNNKISQLMNPVNGNKREQMLVSLGVAIHSYADTWAHQRFSGRHSADDNDIERINILSDISWSMKLIYGNELGFMPDIGHAEASACPDLSFLKWEYEHDATGIKFQRNNTNEFLNAAEAIYKKFLMITGNDYQWKKFSKKLEKCLALEVDSISDKFKMFENEFDIDFDYTDKEWEKAALIGDSFAWKNFEDSDYNNIVYNFNSNNNKNMLWFYFNIAAYEQRQFIISKIRTDLL